jgi:hypothetical protein
MDSSSLFRECESHSHILLKVGLRQKKVFDFIKDLWMHPMHMLFGGFSSKTLVGVDDLHLINLWRKAYLQYKSLPYLLFNYVLHFLK